ncbi:hypothetical protein CI238_01551 [Colletotrichum incanum]|uniref:Uncharacterized protein n=1 Tax=Colletotrichum incanum TaxID=1573173 RepID=A0A166SDB0_COLIC|nr:hypothetical protein CI238_01551 [Colletotrichum incanum]
MTKPLTILLALTSVLFPLAEAKACTEGLEYCGYNLLRKGMKLITSSRESGFLLRTLMRGILSSIVAVTDGSAGMSTVAPVKTEVVERAITASRSC